jgi:hypothetical protein
MSTPAEHMNSVELKSIVTDEISAISPLNISRKGRM